MMYVILKFNDEKSSIDIVESIIYSNRKKKNNTLQHSQRPIPDYNIKLKGNTLKIT